MGIEFGYQTHVAEEIDKTSESVPFDVVLLSNHLFRGKDFYVDRECYDLPKKDLHREYIGIMAEMCEKCNNFDVAAHYDYINRYSPNKDSYVLYEDCPKEFDRLFEALISKEKALEINTKSIQKHKEGGRHWCTDRHSSWRRKLLERPFMRRYGQTYSRSHRYACNSNECTYSRRYTEKPWC